MAYTDITNYSSPNFTSGRQGRAMDKIVLHWWGDPNTNPSFEGVISHLCNPSVQASAHLVVTGTGRRCAQLVDDKDTAWHAGDWEANLTSIGIEADPRCRNEDYDVLAEVIADYWIYYKKKLPLYRHRDFSATQCNGNYDMDRIRAEAEAWYKKKTNQAVEEPAKPETPKEPEEQEPTNPVPPKEDENTNNEDDNGGNMDDTQNATGLTQEEFEAMQNKTELTEVDGWKPVVPDKIRLVIYVFGAVGLPVVTAVYQILAVNGTIPANIAIQMITIIGTCIGSIASAFGIAHFTRSK